jgi:LysR substrate binding domain
MLPRFIVSEDLKSGRLKTVLDEFRVPSLAVFALYPPTRYVQNKVRVFIDYLVDHFGSSFVLEDGGPLVPSSMAEAEGRLKRQLVFARTIAPIGARHQERVLRFGRPQIQTIGAECQIQSRRPSDRSEASRDLVPPRGK